MGEQAFATAEPVWTHRPTRPANSLGPADPSWLAKLSTHLGIHAAKTISPLLMSIWPGASVAAVCCREACACLLQADTSAVPGLLVESTVKHALKRRGLPYNPSLSVRSVMEKDPHFVLEQNENDSNDMLVRLDKSSMPAPAIAELYLNGSGDRVLSPEHALFHAATALTWPRALTSDDDYLACHIAALLVDDSMRPAPDRNLPRHSMHLTEVGGALRALSNTDGRLALIFPKGQVAKSRRPRLSEFLSKEELRPYFRTQESKIRASEKVVTLRTDVLLRSLGPMVGLLQKALLSPDGPSPPTIACGSTPPEHAWSANDTANNMETRPSGSMALSSRPSAVLDTADSSGARTPVKGGSASLSFAPRAPSLFFSTDRGRGEVPQQIRDCWADATPKLNGGVSTSAPEPARRAPTPAIPVARPAAQSAAQFELSRRLHSSAAHASGIGGTRGERDVTDDRAATATRTPGGGSTMFSYASEETSDAPAPGSATAVLDGSWSASRAPLSTRDGAGAGGDDAGAGESDSSTALLRRASSLASGHGNAGGAAPFAVMSSTAAALSSLRSCNSSLNGRSLATSAAGGTAGGGASGAGLDYFGGGTPGATVAQFCGAQWGSSIWSSSGPADAAGASGGGPGDAASWRQHGFQLPSPSNGVTGQSTGHRTCGQQQAATVASSTAQSDYASVLRSNSGAAAQLQPPPQREDRAPAPASSGSAVPGLDELPKYLNGIAAELLALLPARYASAALADTAVAAPRFMHDDRVCRASINAEFIAAAGHLLRTVPALAGALDGASAATVRQIMLSPERGADHSHGGGVSAASAMSAPVSSASLAALKPQVRKEIQALLEVHASTLRLEHFDSGVVCHLQRRPEAAAAAALREIGRRSDFVSANNKPAYLTHWLMKLTSPGDVSAPSNGSNGRSAAAATPVKAAAAGRPDLRRLPRSVQAATERLVGGSPWVEWRHFDAGVAKVLLQLAITSESDALCEMRQVEASELSSVKNMPAYLNKCFNNRLWRVQR